MILNLCTEKHGLFGPTKFGYGGSESLKLMQQLVRLKCCEEEYALALPTYHRMYDVFSTQPRTFDRSTSKLLRQVRSGFNFLLSHALLRTTDIGIVGPLSPDLQFYEEMVQHEK